jgi:predicted RNA-binding protein with PIN domain
MEVLLVDGYNIIGAWPELNRLKQIDLESARDLLISKMAEYQAYTGTKVIIVFDAHLVPGIQQVYSQYDVTIVFTKENETADEKIEQLAFELKDSLTQLYVATSDYAEQKAIFGQGALRKSARELQMEMEKVEKHIQQKIESDYAKPRPAKIRLTPEIQEKFEKMRRGLI